MKRWLGVSGFALILASLVGGQGTAPRLTPVEQVRLYERNRQLVRSAVESSLELAEPPDNLLGWLERADVCTNLARRWSREIEQAAAGREAARTSELTGHLDRLIKQGVAANISLAREKIEQGSMYERELFRRRDEAINVLRPLQQVLRDSEPNLKTLADGIEQLERAAKKVK